MKNIGLLGGSFDPPHKGHLYISLEAKKILKLDKIWWLVTPQNPLKIIKPATYEERIKNCHAITKNQPIKVTDIEKKVKRRSRNFFGSYLDQQSVGRVLMNGRVLSSNTPDVIFS